MKLTKMIVNKTKPAFKVLSPLLVTAALSMGGLSAVHADETCMSPYMAKIQGQEDFVYVGPWVLKAWVMVKIN